MQRQIQYIYAQLLAETEAPDVTQCESDNDDDDDFEDSFDSEADSGEGEQHD